MHQDFDQPEWLPLLNLWIQRLGRRRALAFLCLLGWALALLLSQLAISLIGHGDRLVAALCASFCALSLSLFFGHLLLRLIEHLDQSQRRLTRHATLDVLTGIFNRRHFLNLVEREWSLARRYDTACALVLIDVDHFRRVNDCFGHRCGDTLLRQIAEASSETLRQADVLARFGGEEFILFLPHTDPLGALDVAERIRERVQALDFSWNNHAVPISVSLGVAALNSEHLTLDHLIHDADDALSAAKSAGRNCVRAGEGLLPGKPSRMLRS